MTATKKPAGRAVNEPSGLPEGLEVWLDDPTFGPLTHLGRLHRAGQDSVRFEYSPLWLKNAVAFALDPELSLASGNFHPKDSNFGIFMDSCLRCPSNFVFQRAALMPPGTAEKHAC